LLNSIRNIILFFLVFVLLSQELYTQSLNFYHYSTDDGLPQSTINDIVQDSIGFIWFGTEAGIGRFDGVNVKTYDLSDGLIGNNIGALTFDKYGGLWIGTNSGLSILFEDEIKNYNTNNGLPDDFIYGIVEDDEGDVWVATRYGGACKFIGKQINIYDEASGFPSNQLSGVFKDSKGNIWFSTYNVGIIKYNGSEFVTYSEKDGLLSNRVHTIFEDKEGLLWIGTNRGVTTFNGRTFFQFSRKEGFPEEEIEVIIEDKQGDIWFGLNTDGVYRYNGRKITQHTGLTSNEIRSGFVDKRGDIWFGAFLGGVSRLPAEWFEIYSVPNGLADKAVYPIAQDSYGKMYFGHYGKGVSVFENGNFKRLSTSTGLISNNLSSILYDSGKNLWFGTLKGVTKISDNYRKSFYPGNGLKLDNVLKIFEDSKGYIWLGSIGGITKIDPTTDKILAEYSESEGFTNVWFNDIYEDNKGKIWFATHSFGLVTYDGNSFSKIDTADGLPINNIFSVIQDKYGYYWFGTDGKGICRYDGNNFINIAKTDGLTSDVCYFILEDEEELYIGTINGLTIITNKSIDENKNLNIRYISKNEGIPSKELNQGAYFKDSQGYLWFGTQDGLVKIDPKKKINDKNLPIFLSGINVSDGFNEKKFNSIIDEELNYEQNNVSFEFYSISFAKPEKTIFEFMLEGVEDNWSQTRENIVTYRALPSGEYKFWVKAKNNADDKTKARLLASFVIAAPFYKTWWFITSSVLIFVLFSYGTYFYKTYQVSKRNEALAGMVKDRTRELEVEKNKSDELLHNILPSSLVDELKIYGNVRPRKFNSISIMFTDFKSFTYTTSVLPPEELVNELNDIFKNFDSLIGKYGLEKLKTIGDSYMAACGIPNEMEDHAIRIVYAALDFQKMIKERNKTAPIKWEMRLGVHSGSVVAGVVGTKKFTYDIWGDTVNIASRMESSGEPGEINISGYTYMLVRDHFDCEYRGKIDTKGKGGIDMYFVKGVNQSQISNPSVKYKTTNPIKQIS